MPKGRGFRSVNYDEANICGGTERNACSEPGSLYRFDREQQPEQLWLQQCCGAEQRAGYFRSDCEGGGYVQLGCKFRGGAGAF